MLMLPVIAVQCEAEQIERAGREKVNNPSELATAAQLQLWRGDALWTPPSETLQHFILSIYEIHANDCNLCNISVSND